MKLIVGLGNPGPRYHWTRHNAGFLVLDELARRHGLSFKGARNAAEARLGGVLLVKPQTFMNLSGQAVQAYASRAGIRPAEMLVVHDDLDMPLGRLRFKAGGGGSGGAGGVKDIIGRIGPDFTRLKVGIGRPPDGWTVENWVLSKFREDERALLARVVEAAADAVELLLAEGLEPAANRYNGLDLAAASESEPPASPSGERPGGSG